MFFTNRQKQCEYSRETHASLYYLTFISTDRKIIINTHVINHKKKESNKKRERERLIERECILRMYALHEREREREKHFQQNKTKQKKVI